MFSLLLPVIYLAFISLGLPDALLGSAWPSIYQNFQVPLSYAGMISMIISAGTIVSSLLSDRLTRWLGTGKVTLISVFVTAAALFGFSFSNSFLLLCLWAVPYGLGAGSVDASINNYVAIHYSSRHMNWLHCMWGLGATAGPYAMAYALSRSTWHTGYRIIGVFQVALTVILFLSLPLWKKRTPSTEGGDRKAISIRKVLGLPGAKAMMITFFCYCALEQTAGLWAATYLVVNREITEETAAGYASLFYLGITVGRSLAGFVSNRLGDKKMVLLGEGIVLGGIVMILLPVASELWVLGGLILVGLGCAPIYPALLHATPAHFGEDKSQAIMGMQMASAYVGICAMPPLFGLLSQQLGVWLYPVYLAVILAAMGLCYQIGEKRTKSCTNQGSL